MLLNPRQSSAQSVDVEVNANLVPYADEARMEAVLENDHDWNFESAVGCDDMERVSVKQRFRDLQKSWRI